MIDDRESAKLANSIEGSLLSSGQIVDAVNRVANLRNRDNWYVDFELMDDYISLFPDLAGEIRASMKDKSCTKMFVDWNKTFEALEHFKGGDGKDYSWTTNFRVADACLRNQCNITELKPMYLHDGSKLKDWFDDLTTSAGAIGRGSKGDNEALILKTALDIKRRIAKSEDLDRLWIPALPAHRAQISGYVNLDGKYCGQSLKRKDRLVWIVDGATVAVEAQYARPLLNHCCSRFDSYAGGKDPDRLRNLMARISRLPYWVGLDYSKFDQTLPAWLIHRVFNVIRDFFPRSCRQELFWIEDNFIHTKMLLPDGSIFVKDHGVPSGSNFTQLVDSFANFLMIITFIASLCNGNFDEKYRYVMRQLRDLGVGKRTSLALEVLGDDGVFGSWYKVDVKALASYVYKVFGVRIGADKSGSGERGSSYPGFLKREWRRFGEYRDPLEMIINQIHPEYERRYEGYCGWHIIYGMWLMYKEAFPKDTSEQWLVRKMYEGGGVSALVKLETRDLPGVYRGFSKHARDQMFRRATKIHENG